MQSEPMKSHSSSSAPVLVAAWLVVGVPLLWGVAQTITKALALFR
jgi:hypothetical protein